jgi:fibronectin type 3 domain-containing protein
VPAPGLTFDDTTADHALYWYKVRAVDAVGDGIMSAANSGYRALAAPTGVAATDGTLNDRVRVTWTATTGATSYKVYRAATLGGTYSLLGTVTVLQFDDLVGDTTVRFYRVVAVNSNTTSGFSTPDAGNAAFPAPTGVTATDGTLSDRVRISWNAVPGATSYKVFRATTQNGTYTQLGSPTTATTFDNTIGASTTFWFAVKATNGAGDSWFSAADSGFAGVAPPLNVAASDGTFYDRISISWDAVAGATGYKVYRSTALTGTYTQIGTPTGNQFDDLNSTPGDFYYKVKTTKALGDSYFSNADAGRILSSPAISATDGTLSDRIRVSWPAATGATSYKLYRATSQAGAYTLIATTPLLQLDITTGSTAVLWFKVAASNASGDSVLSTEDSGFAGVAAPTGVAASDGTFADHIAVTWNAVGGATSYKIFRSATSNGTYTQIDTSATANYDDFSVAAGTFFYKIKTTTGAGDSWFSGFDGGSKS